MGSPTTDNGINKTVDVPKRLKTIEKSEIGIINNPKTIPLNQGGIWNFFRSLNTSQKIIKTSTTAPINTKISLECEGLLYGEGKEDPVFKTGCVTIFGKTVFCANISIFCFFLELFAFIIELFCPFVPCFVL